MRLDIALVEWGFVSSRSRAKDLLQRGYVELHGRVVRKSNTNIRLVDRDALWVTDHAWVSRSALKLVGALDALTFDGGRQLITGRRGLDVGASTGGFTQVLLERGASHVTALDVGKDQLHETLAQNARVLNLQGVNARDLTADKLNGPIEILVADVSFISLKLAMPPALSLAQRGAHLFSLIKPQFEVGKNLLGKGGVVRDEQVRQGAIDDLVVWFDNQPGWRVKQYVDSSLHGPDGNREAIVHATKDKD